MDDLDKIIADVIERSQENPIIRAIVKFSQSQADVARILEVLGPYNPQVTNKYLITGINLLKGHKESEFTKNFLEAIISQHFPDHDLQSLNVHLNDPRKFMGGLTDILFRQYIGTILPYENIDETIGENLLLPNFELVNESLFLGTEGIYRLINILNKSFNRVITLKYVWKKSRKGKAVIRMKIKPDYNATLKEVFTLPEVYDMVVKGIVDITRTALKIPPKAVDKESDLAEVNVDEIDKNSIYDFTVEWKDYSPLVRNPRDIWDGMRKGFARLAYGEIFEQLAGHEVQNAARVHAADAFGRDLSTYLAGEIVEMLRAGLGPELKKGRKLFLTMFFTDIFESTYISDTSEYFPEIMQEYQKTMTILFKKYDAFIDNIIGDAFFGNFGMENFFGDKGEQNHKDNAVKCTELLLEMNDATQQISDIYHPDKIKIPLQMRAGVTSGEVLLKSYGTEFRWQFTTRDLLANIVSRLEHECERSKVLMDAETHRLTKDSGRFKYEPGEYINVKGVLRPLETFYVTSRHTT